MGFERKILRKIFDSKNNKEGQYEIRTNEEFKSLFGEPNITGVMKNSRIKWTGHVWRSKGVLGKIKEIKDRERTRINPDSDC